uniref:PIN domain-containing protein n=1 Tax=Oryza punctata TaxID=4537 RepID=A0A0E0L853_ORYPU
MGRAKNKGPKFAAVKKIITKKTIQKYKEDVLNPKKKDNEKEKLGRNASGLFGTVLQLQHSAWATIPIAKDPRFQRLACTHKGTYADDCIVERVTQHKCYIVATCDRDLKRRIRKLFG